MKDFYFIGMNHLLGEVFDDQSRHGGGCQACNNV